MQSLKTIRTVDLKSVLHRVLTLLPKDSVSEDMLEEWAYQAYESIAPREAYEIHVTTAQVSNHTTELPKGLFGLELVLYRVKDTEIESKRTYPMGSTTTECTTSTDINTGCTTEIKTTIDITTEVTKPLKLNKDKDYGVYKGDGDSIVKEQLDYNSPFKQNYWRPLPPTSNSMMKGYLVGLPKSLYMGCEHTFSLNRNCMITTFSEGYVAIAYTGLPTNDDGDFVILDYEHVGAAIECYLKKKYWEWRTNLREAGAGDLYMMYSREYEVLSAKSTAQMMMPTLMEYQRLRNMNKFIREDSPFAIGTGASNKQEKVFYNNIYTGRLWL